MSISGIQSTQMAYETVSSQKTNPSVDVAAERHALSDSVTISAAAREMNQHSAAAESGQATDGLYQPWIDDGSDNLELMYIPEQYEDLYPYALEPVKLGMSADTERRAAYGRLSSAEREDLSEYISTLSEHYRAERNARGIESNDEFQTLTADNEKLSNEIHQSIRERMLADPRTVELMQEFGIEF